ncbi:MAG: hypothetical protein CM15mP103_04950 [Gammaproteobacteria bacterium]|nr:MAG: hypothetical protein CM15mP103_04950 [Gammaproteobacteria bacterium]
MHERGPGIICKTTFGPKNSPGYPGFRRKRGVYWVHRGGGACTQSAGFLTWVCTAPYSRYGQLVYDMWRAVRLWSNRHPLFWLESTRAIDYFSITPPSPRRISSTRSTATSAGPGQGTGLQDRPTENAGAQKQGRRPWRPFDIRASTITCWGGSLSLDILEAAWTLGGSELASQAAKPRLSPAPSPHRGPAF